MMDIPYNNDESRNSESAPISLEDDESFMEVIQNKTKMYGRCTMYGLFALVVSVIFLLTSPTDNVIILFAFQVIRIISLLAIIFFIWRLRETWGVNYFLTSKRLYIQQSKNEDYQSFTQDSIKSISYKNDNFRFSGCNFGLILTLNNGEIIHLSSVFNTTATRNKLMTLFDIYI